jgi:hypothetical protein
MHLDLRVRRCTLIATTSTSTSLHLDRPCYKYLVLVLKARLEAKLGTATSQYCISFYVGELVTSFSVVVVSSGWSLAFIGV